MNHRLNPEDPEPMPRLTLSGFGIKLRNMEILSEIDRTGKVGEALIKRYLRRPGRESSKFDRGLLIRAQSTAFTSAIRQHRKIR